MKLQAVFSALAVAVMVAPPGWAQDCCTPCQPAYRIQYKTITETVPVTTWRWQVENLVEERQVTNFRGDWVTEMRSRRVRVARPVTETSVREERQIVLKPVLETSEEERFVDRTTFVTETGTRQERHIVNRPVTETVMQEQRQVVRRAVNETVMQQTQQLAWEPVTSFRTQVVDQGGFVDQSAVIPGQTRNRLSWVPRGWATDANSGLVFKNPGGLRCVPFQSPGTVVTQRVYVPNLVSQQVAQTNFVAKVVTQDNPVNVTRFVDEVVSQQVPVQTTRMEQVEEVRDIPFTVQRPVTERIVEKVPVQRTRWERQEMVREVPVTTQRIEYEERDEEFPVQVYKVTPETRTIQVPRSVGQWVGVQTTRTVARTVAMRVPIGSEIVDETLAPVIESRRPVTETLRPIVEDPITLPPVLTVPKRTTQQKPAERPLEKVGQPSEWRPVPSKAKDAANEKPALDPDAAKKAKEKLELNPADGDDL